jgi:hypothetical protein
MLALTGAILGVMSMWHAWFDGGPEYFFIRLTGWEAMSVRDAEYYSLAPPAAAIASAMAIAPSALSARRGPAWGMAAAACGLAALTAWLAYATYSTASITLPGMRIESGSPVPLAEIMGDGGWMALAASALMIAGGAAPAFAALILRAK